MPQYDANKFGPHFVVQPGRWLSPAPLIALALLAMLPLAGLAQPAAPAANASRPAQSEGAQNQEAAANAEAIRRRAEAAHAAASSAQKSSAADMRQLQDAAAVNRLLIAAGEIGMRRAVDPAVQGLAQSMVARQRALAGELEGIAKNQGAAPGKASGVGGSHGTLLAQLQKDGGFDTRFVREAGIEVPTQALARLGTPPGPGGDPAWLAWRGKFVDTLRDQLAIAQQIPLRNAADRTPRSSSGDPGAAPGGKP